GPPRGGAAQAVPAGSGGRPPAIVVRGGPERGRGAVPLRVHGGRRRGAGGVALRLAAGPPADAVRAHGEGSAVRAHVGRAEAGDRGVAAAEPPVPLDGRAGGPRRAGADLRLVPRLRALHRRPDVRAVLRTGRLAPRPDGPLGPRRPTRPRGRPRDS